jgi:hypothetical protein
LHFWAQVAHPASLYGKFPVHSKQSSPLAEPVFALALPAGQALQAASDREVEKWPGAHGEHSASAW